MKIALHLHDFQHSISSWLALILFSIDISSILSNPVNNEAALLLFSYQKCGKGVPT